MDGILMKKEPAFASAIGAYDSDDEFESNPNRDLYSQEFQNVSDKYMINNDVTISGKIDRIIFGIGASACHYLNIYFIVPNGEKIADLEYISRSEDYSQRLYEKTRIYLLKTLEHRVCLVLSPAMKNEQYNGLHSWLQKIFNIFPDNKEHWNTIKCNVLCSSYLSNYKPEVNSTDFLIRSLISNNNHADVCFPPVPTLDIPNIVTGVPAYILSQCRIQKIPCMLCIAYHSSAESDLTAKAYTKKLASCFSPVFVGFPTKCEAGAFEGELEKLVIKDVMGNRPISADQMYT